LTVTSTRTGSACGELTLKRNVAPSGTRGGTDTLTVWRTIASPVPQQAAHGSGQRSPRPPQARQVPRRWS